jgi:predicted NUDIX family NTP pyrophosphohydrolase
MFRRRGDRVELFLVHPGGPFYRSRDDGVWSIPKGEIGEGEEPLAAALREFHEETGIEPRGDFVPLGSVRQRSGKTVQAWAFEGDWDGQPIHSNRFTLEWPPGSGQLQEFPEADRAEFFAPVEARRKLNPAQADLVDALLAALDGAGRGPMPGGPRSGPAGG